MNSVFKPKLFTLIKQGIQGKDILSDAMSGIVVGIIALPLAIAFAVASGVSPEKGIVTAILAGFIISALGGSRVQIGGPTGAFIVIVYGIIEKYGVDGLVISTILAGMMLIAFGLCRMGTLLKYIPDPLIIGFTSGIALVIFTTQIKDALGLDIPSMSGSFFHKWELCVQHLDTINPIATGLTLLTILMVVFAKKVTPKIPGSFAAILLVTAAVSLFELPVTTIGSFFGEIRGAFEFSLPSVDFANLGHYLSPAITIAILGAIESLLSAVVADGMISGNHRSNTELIAQGIANMVVPFFGGIPATGAIARTAANIKNGGKTPISGMVHSLTLLVIMLFFGNFAKLIPMCCLAGILIVVAYNMSEWRLFYLSLKGSLPDVTVLLSTFLLTVFFDLAIAIEVGIVLSALLFMKRMSDIGRKIPSEVDSDLFENYSDIPEGIAIYEINGPLFFASAKQYAEGIKEVGLKTRYLIIRMRHVPFIDATGLKNLRGTIQLLAAYGVEVILSGVNNSVFRDLEKSGVIHLVRRPNVFKSFYESIEYTKSLKNLLKEVEVLVPDESLPIAEASTSLD